MLRTDRQELVESTTRGAPACRWLWTARSLRNLALALQQRGHDVKKHPVARLLKHLGESLQGNKQCLEGAQHPDRHAQCEHSKELGRAQLHANDPALSVDTQNQEVGGASKKSGRELRPKHAPERVQAYAFPEEDQPKAVPYGVYDLAENEAWVSVGLRHDTGACAVETMRTWCTAIGRPLEPDASSRLIMADGGGSTG
jgi:hypothetical protein